MTKEMKALLKLIIKADILVGIIIAVLISLVNFKGSFIFLLGIIIALFNFIFTGIILDKSLNGGRGSFLYKFTAVARILIIVLIALLFSHNKYYLLLYIAGFLTHFPTLIFSYIRSQKGGCE